MVTESGGEGKDVAPRESGIRDTGAVGVGEGTEGDAGAVNESVTEGIGAAVSDTFGVAEDIDVVTSGFPVISCPDGTAGPDGPAQAAAQKNPVKLKRSSILFALFFRPSIVSPHDH